MSLVPEALDHPVEALTTALKRVFVRNQNIFLHALVKKVVQELEVEGWVLRRMENLPELAPLDHIGKTCYNTHPQSTHEAWLHLAEAHLEGFNEGRG